MRSLLLSMALAVANFAEPEQSATVTKEARHLEQVLDKMQVEKNWKAGEHVNWRTGKMDREGVKAATHCSAFAAAAAANLGVYLLRPPDHSQVLLANAQQHWLEKEGREKGWFQVKSGWQAQQEANRGLLVVATYANPDHHKPGHIAVVRPSTRTKEQVEQDGPEITQAGRNNYNHTRVKVGFSHHPGAFDKGEILYFAHKVP